MSTSVSSIEIEKQIAIFKAQADIAKIETPDDYRDAEKFVANIVRKRKEIDGIFDPIIKKQHEAHAEAIAQKRRLTDPLARVLAYIDGKMLEWRRRQEAMRREAEAKLAEQMRREREDQALAEAAELARQGEQALAEEVIRLETEAPAPVVSIPSVIPKPEGFTTKKVWRFRISDKNRDPKTSIIPDEFWILDETRIAGMVRTLKSSAAIPGVEVFSEDTAVHRVKP